MILLLLGLGLLSGSALLAFSWAARDGQLENLDRAAEVIFDAGEPVGVAGDCFPDAAGRAARARESAVCEGERGGDGGEGAGAGASPNLPGDAWEGRRG